MPRISAATVAEHRAAQLAALLGAAVELIHEKGIEAVTPKAVGERAGLARSSVYEYFASRDDILVAVAIAAIERWDAEVEERLAGRTGMERLSLFVYESMRMAAEGRHHIATQLAQAQLSPNDRDELARMHAELMRPVDLVLSDLEVEQPTIVGALTQSLLEGGMRLVEHGADPDVVADRIVRMLTSAIQH
ncbi:TetR/AcrR family transcriptional regulator [Leifsonia poae]|uniref:TetR/AcrR family transcriptional regulator n=1 Tax=Leifsonia poae TaxID=110933 RepID=UPI003D692519